MTVQLMVSGATPTHKNVPRLDITSTYDVSQWVTNGLSFFGRADGFNASPVSGQLDLTDRIAASTKTLNQPTGQTAILTKSDVGFLGDRKTLEFGQGAGTAVPSQHMDSGGSYLPTTGAFAVYMAIHPFASACDLIGGQDDRSKFFVTLVNGQIRFQVANSGSNCVLDTGLSTAFKNMNMLIGVIRRSDGYLVVRLRKQGDSAWTEQVSGAANAGTILAPFRVGKVRSTFDSGSNAFYGRHGGLLVQNGAMSAPYQTDIEKFMSHYWSIA